MNIELITFKDHGKGVQDIFNYYILNTHHLYEYNPRSLEVVEDWFRLRELKDWPVLGVVERSNNNGTILLGFASFGPFRPQQAYQHTVEHSVYVHPKYYLRGIATQLMQELIKRVQALSLHTMVGVIDAENHPSIALHQKFGFELAGKLKEVGFKGDQWRDIVFYLKHV